MNCEGVYHHFATGENISTFHFYQVRQKAEARNYHKVKTEYFWFKRLYNTCTQNLGMEKHFEGNGVKIYTKDDRTKKSNIKEDGNDGNGQVDDSDVETVDIPGYDAPQGLVS